MRELLIDGDSLVYRFAHGDQKTIEWPDQVVTVHADLMAARASLDAFIEQMRKDLRAESYHVALSDLNGCFRKQVYSAYKSNRAGVVRPILFAPLRLHMIEEHNAHVLPRLEGDDVLGVWTTDPSAETSDDPEATQVECVVCSIDKDLLTVPGLVHDWDHPERGEGGVVAVDEGAAEWAFYRQVLTGDPVDGYPGVPGIGPVKADRLLDAHGDLKGVWKEVILPAYRKAGLEESFALRMARCARILRHGDLKYSLPPPDGGDCVDIKLWTPPGSRKKKEWI